MDAGPFEVRLIPQPRGHRPRPEHHIIPSANSTGWTTYLPSWDPSPASSRPKKASDKHTEQLDKVLESRYKDIAGFRNPWPSWHKPTQQETWESLQWGSDHDPAIDLAASHLPPDDPTPKPEDPSRMPRFSDIDDWPNSTGAQAARLLQMQKPDFTFDQTTKAKATWLGHAGVLLQLSPLSAGSEPPTRCLFDPIFSMRCSPSQLAGPIRTYPPPCSIKDLPPIDMVFISHNHYDHLDYDTIKALWQANSDRLHFFVPLANLRWFTECGIPPERVTELDWWEGAEVRHASAASASAALKITATPAQHSSGRTGMDSDSTLWCGWYLEHTRPKSAEPCRIFFAGDTGYQFHHSPDWPPSPPSPSPPAGSAAVSRTSTLSSSKSKETLLQQPETEFPTCPAFETIRSRLGPPHLLLLPVAVGATYSYFRSFVWVPDWVSPFPRHSAGLTAATHMPPWDAVRVMRVLTGQGNPDADMPVVGDDGSGGQEGAVAIAMHWGTFVPDPIEVLKTLGQLEWACMAQGVRFARSLPSARGAPCFLALNHGQSVSIP